MEIEPVRAEHAEQLRTIYLAHVAHSPHCCFTPDSTRFRDELLGKLTQPTALFRAPHLSQLFVAEASGIAQGFATFVTYQDWNDQQRQAITGLFFANEAAGDALIHACETQATADEIGAFPPGHGNTPILSYNAGWDGLSDRIPGVAQLLAQHGYTPHFRELHLITQLHDSHPKPLPPGITLAVSEVPAGADSLGSRFVRARDGENEVGVCSISTLAYLSDDPAASQTGYIWWLHVNEAYRRRGIARALMAAAWEQMIQVGCSACWLTTTADNWRAQALYYDLGFNVVDCSVSFQKKRSENSA